MTEQGYGEALLCERIRDGDSELSVPSLPIQRPNSNSATLLNYSALPRLAVLTRKRTRHIVTGKGKVFPLQARCGPEGG